MGALLKPLGRVVGVQVGSGPVSKWPRRFDVKGLSPEQWIGLMDGVLRRGDADALAFQGAPAERGLVGPIARRLARDWPGRVHDWTGRFNLAELLGLMAGYRALISVDTGPAHMAAAIGCPLLVFFGPSDPAEYRMRGPGAVETVVGSSPCQFCAGTDRFKRCEDNRCLRGLGTDALLHGWVRLMGRINRGEA
jgi:ADP-heptose:LPS heptosyltransferase